MKCRILFTTALILAYVAADAAQNTGTLRPVDEAATNPDFLAFRTRLKTIVAKHDTASLLEIVHPEIRASFGSHHGVAAFTELWKLDQPDSELWKELGAVLELGGSFSGPSEFTAPYTFSRWPQASIRLSSSPSLVQMSDSGASLVWTHQF